ncbi:hypothetical protein ACT01_08150 [Megasphaera hexanoica]|nr:hypothetical protein ACT01_08150 [Megasphaera hexanoica]
MQGGRRRRSGATKGRWSFIEAGLTDRLFLHKNQQDSAATAGVLRQASPTGPSDARRMEGVIAALWRLTTTRQMMVPAVRHSK